MELKARLIYNLPHAWHIFICTVSFGPHIYPLHTFFEKRNLGFIEVMVRLKVACVMSVDTEFEPSILDPGVKLKIYPQS